MNGFAKLGIDFVSLGFYLVNFGVIVFIVSKYIYNPLIIYLDQRRETVHRNLTESEALRQAFELEAKKRQLEYDEMIKAAKSEGYKAKQDAQKLAKQLLSLAEQERERILSEARQQASIIKKQAQAESEEEIVEKIIRMVMVAMKKGHSPEAVSASIKSAWKDNKIL